MSLRDYAIEMYKVGLYCGLCVCSGIFIVAYHSWWLSIPAFGASLVFANKADGILREIEK